MNFLLLYVTLIIAIDLEKCAPKYLLVNLDEAGENGEFAFFSFYLILRCIFIVH